MINYRKIADKFKGLLPCGECRKCGELTDYVVIYPCEEDFLNSISFPCRFKVVDKITCSVGSCTGCSIDFYKERPIDCKTYPYAVMRIDSKYYLYVSKLCPLHSDLPQEFTDDVRYIWEHLLTKPEIIEYIEDIPTTNFNDILEWEKYSEIYPTTHEELD